MNVRMARRRRRWFRPFALAVLAVASLVGAAPGMASSQSSSSLAESLARNRPDLRALVVARGACVVFEYYREGIGPQTRSPVYSVAKSVLSILVGIAIDQGLISLDEPLAALAPEVFDPPTDPIARDITIRDLLAMTAGLEAAPTSPPATSLRAMLQRPLTSAPGDRFAYNGMAADLLSVALSRAIRQDARSFARSRLFEPLGIRNYAWTLEAEGRLSGESNLFLTARDMAKIGLLYLQGGRWGDRRIVSEAFAEQSTSRRSAGGPPLGAAYGYLWWVGKTRAGLDAFFAAGSGGQLIYVVPALDLVVAVAAQAGDDYNLGLVSDVALPLATGAPASTPCAARLGPSR